MIAFLIAAWHDPRSKAVQTGTLTSATASPGDTDDLYSKLSADCDVQFARWAQHERNLRRRRIARARTA